MWKILLFVFIEYVVISLIISIDAYEPKNKKRLKRLIKLILWLLTGVVTGFIAKENRDYALYFIISVYFSVSYLLAIINPYLQGIFFNASVYSLIGFFIWKYWYAKHPIIVWGVVLILVGAALDFWKGQISKMRSGIDADIETEEEYQEKNRKKKRKKTIFKFVRLAYKAWRI